MWNEAESRCCTTSDPDTYPVLADKLDQALNQLNISVLDEVQSSGLYELAGAALPRSQGGILILAIGDL